MTDNLTIVAALPQGGGCMSALPAEKNEAKKPKLMPLWMGVDLGQQESATVYWTRATADLAFDSFIDWGRIAIDLGPIGGVGC